MAIVDIVSYTDMINSTLADHKYSVLAVAQKKKMVVSPYH